jgi:hypothetical protein
MMWDLVYLCTPIEYQNKVDEIMDNHGNLVTTFLYECDDALTLCE